MTRSIDAALTSYLGSFTGHEAAQLLWVQARNRTTGATETIGLSTRDDVDQITIDGQLRTYIGGRVLMSVEPFEYTAGLDVRVHRVTLSGIAPSVEQMVRQYDARLAPVEVHRAIYNTDTGAMVGAPERKLKGRLMGAGFQFSQSGEATCDLSIASSARDLTRSLTGTYSSSTLKAVRPGDGFFDFADLSGSVQVEWD